MVRIVCDSCKKPVKNGKLNEGYFSILKKNLCVECNNELVSKVETSMDGKKTYQFLTYKEVLADTLERMCR